MAIVKKTRFETANAFWTVEITDRPDGQYRCEYFGTTPKYAKALGGGEAAPTMADMGRGITLGKNVDALLAETRTRIEAIDGPIEREL